MNINLTLLGQAISFGIFVWFCMKYVWPPILKALEERAETIADGLAAAERGNRHLEEAKERVEKLWIHCKNFEAMRWFTLIGGFNHFWHQEDDFTLTSRGVIWTYTGKDTTPKSICVLPENSDNEIGECLGICSDYIENYRENK